MNSCPICEAEIPRERVMCAAHWRLVTWEIKAWVQKAWKIRASLIGSRDLGAQVSAAKEHQIAKVAAIMDVQKAIEAAPPKKKSQGKLPL